MSKITGGSVKYGRTLKTGDFENKRVDVELQFSVEDGEDHTKILEAAAKEAHAKAHALLGIKPASAQVAEIASKEPIPGQKETAAARMNAGETEAKPAKAKPGPKPKVETPLPAEKAGEDLEGFDEDAVESQPEITDAALSTAMNRKVAELKPAHGGAAPKLIKELINTFVEPPKKSHDIPQKLRAEFLKKLEALK